MADSGVGDWSDAGTTDGDETNDSECCLLNNDMYDLRLVMFI